MKDIERKKAIKEFVARWTGKGYEKGETQPFWLDLLSSVFGVEKPTEFIKFEDKVKTDKNTTDFMDGFIENTLVLIEQKSIDVDLNKGIRQSDGQLLTPYMQARKYIDNLPRSKHPKYVITCNFKSFNIYDMEKPNGQPEIIYLEELEDDFYRLEFIVNSKSELLKKEEEISKKAGDIIGEIYDAFSEEMDMDNKENQKILNILCVRLVFCLYAEDAQLFNKNIFYNFLKNSDVNHIQSDLMELFKVLNTKERNEFTRRDLLEFPYVNGGLFSQEIRIPYFTDKIFDLLINKACQFDWSKISPTIFGGIFESTLNPETRRNNGMHYTSVENIHKVIDPLFLNDLRDEFYTIKSIRTRKDKKRKLLSFQEKISNLVFLDPACGSGNFLTESYRSLRELENEIIAELVKLEGKAEGQLTLGTDESFEPIKVSIQQFYGIEINDFAVSVARTALWIEEAQMFSKTQMIVVNNSNLDSFLPLETYENIIENNALLIDWNDVVSNEKCNYIMGNPPFVGARLMNDNQKEDINTIFDNTNNVGNLDYVACWYKKAYNYMLNTNIEAALVSTNSITQGEQPSILFKPLLDNGLFINYAFKTFRWDSEANLKAHVHCIIIGFSFKERDEKFIYDSKLINKAKYINGYLLDGENIYVESISNPLQKNVPRMDFGSMPNDNGYLSNYSLENMKEIVKEYPEAKQLFKRIYGAEEFINNKERYCLWLKDVSPSVYNKIQPVMEAIKMVRESRFQSKREATKKLADFPMLFGEIRQPNSNYLLVPSTSSEKRRYIPIGFMTKDDISTNANLVVPNAGLYEFGILTSNVHMAWIRAIAGRLKSDYRYSAKIVYNNFPWPSPTKEEQAAIEKTAKLILDARKKYSNCSLADLYGENMFLYPELLRAHQLNDKAVWEAYGKRWNIKSESSCLEELLKMYKELIGDNNAQ